MSFKHFYLKETEEFPDIIKYVGKFGIDKKLKSFEGELKKLTVFESDDKKIIYGTDKNRIKFDIDQDNKKDQLEFERKVYNKSIKEYNNGIKYYYDEVFEKKFINEVDEYRKYLNRLIKAIASGYLIFKELTK